jgi:hypothetical protein
MRTLYKAKVYGTPERENPGVFSTGMFSTVYVLWSIRLVTVYRRLREYTYRYMFREYICEYTFCKCIQILLSNLR